jgi:hypothetical protein
MGWDNLCHRLREAVKMRLKLVAALAANHGEGRLHWTVILGFSIIHLHGCAAGTTGPETGQPSPNCGSAA